MKVVWRSLETYASLLVEKYELVSEPGTVADARCIACLIGPLWVASPPVWKTTTTGGRTPTPNVLSVRWLVSYAGFPGIEKLWYQRLETFAAANAPNSVRTIQTAITGQRRRMTKWARRSSISSRVPAGCVRMW